jgi:hypothetical protein
MMAERKLPALPSSKLLVTVRVDGTVRSSNSSSHGFLPEPAFRIRRFDRADKQWPGDCGDRSQCDKVMGILLQGMPVRAYNGKAASPGAQTVRRGVAWAGEDFAWRRDLTGRLLPFKTVLLYSLSGPIVISS